MNLLLITQRVEFVKSHNERRDSLDQRWIDFIQKCGFVPLICPNNINVTDILLKEIKVSGIILSGGNNLVEYGGDAPERDSLEYSLIDYSICSNIPLVGVCRGMQVILDYFKINMVNVENHINTNHIITSEDNIKKQVNSFHSMGAFDTNNEIAVIYRSEDGVLEKIRHKQYNLHGIMWHPERNIPIDMDDLIFFKKIFCGKE